MGNRATNIRPYAERGSVAFAAHEVVINRDAMTVYGFLMDGMNNSLWRSGVRSIALRSGVRGQKGALYQQTITGPGGRPVAADFRITDARPGAEVRYSVVTGPARSTGGFYLSTEGNTTRLRFALEYHPKGLRKLMNGVIQKALEGEVAQLEQLKIAIEAHPEG
nr:SRPBCC family protein [Paenarthrobacter sp. MSM-2-10-13]